MPKRYHEGGSSKRGNGEMDTSRRTQEMQEAGMIKEDRSAIANLPQEPMIKMYGNSYSYLPEDIDDTIRGIDKQIGEDDRGMKRFFKPKKV
jgi:hypothetical protein